MALEFAMNVDAYPDTYIASLLNSVRTFAVVGASSNTSRPSYFVMKYLMAKGYRVIPVNPGLEGETILDQPVYASLDAIPEPVDVVDIFRNSAAAMDVTREAIALKNKLQLKVIWMQLGVRNDEAACLAEAAGVQTVMNRCPKIEYGRLSGEIGWMGYNMGSVTSKRPLLVAGGVQRHRIGVPNPASSKLKA